MRVGWIAFVSVALLGCTGEAPDPLTLHAEDAAQSSRSLAAVVPFGSAPEPEPAIAPDDAEPEPTPEVSELVPSPLPSTDTVTPRLVFSWEGGRFAWADSCTFGVRFAGGPAVSTDGRYVLHDRRDEFWESDGGEGWEDYGDEEPLTEDSLGLLDLATGTTTWLGPLVAEDDLPHHPDGRIHCRKLRPLLNAGIERVNAEIPGGSWRALQSAEELGIRIITTNDDAKALAEREVDRRPIEFLLRNDSLILRRKGVSVLHREALGPLEKCNMPLELSDALIDLETGYVIASVDERCVCFGDESQRHFEFTLSPDARAEVAELAPIGRAVRDDEGW